MFKKAVCGIMLSLLLIGIFSLAVNIKPVKSEWTGTIYIRADGSIDPPDAPMVTYENVTYILMDNIYTNTNGIIVERSGIKIEGLGHTIQGAGTFKSNGILLSNVCNVTIKNINVNGFYIGIFHNGSSYCNILGNSIIKNNTHGIALLNSYQNSISGINITRNERGIGLWNSWNNSISGNIITEHVEGWIPRGIYLRDSMYNIISRNIIRKNEEGIYFYNSSYNVIFRNEIMYSQSSILCFYESSNNTIVENIFTDNNGRILLYYSSNKNAIVKNNITNNWCGVILDSSHYNNISRNVIKANSRSGIEINLSSNNTIIGNFVEDNQNGIYLLSSHNNIISRNIVRGNINCGIHFEVSSYDKVFENSIENNGNGTWFAMASNNLIYHNNFINNIRQVYDLSWDTPFIIPSINVWDDGYPSGGNYWSDYKGGDYYSGAYQNVSGSDGIGDTPYVIDENNIDHYPLMNPWGSGTPIASFTWTPSAPEVGEVVTFDASASMPIGGEIVRYEWDFGDGSHATGRIITHVYGSAGTFTVTLNVTDSEGLWDIEQKRIEVKAPPPPLTVSISPLSASILVGQSITFTSTTSGGYPPYTYQWYLNGNPVLGATSQSWTFTPTTSGIYYVYLKVTDSKGNTAQSNTARIIVATVPVGGYSIPINVNTRAEPAIPYIMLMAILTITFTVIKRKTIKNRR